MLFTWQINEWQKIWRLKEQHRLPHALLFLGIPGIGKTNFAEHLTKKILCQALSESLVCSCHSCLLIQNKTHPNLLWIEPEEENHTIKIDQIREVGEFICQTGQQGKYKIVVIDAANRMNVYAANALLKTLEEPSSHSLIILIANQRHQLQATIQSRCQQIIFQKPDKKTALEWLRDQKEIDTVMNLPLFLSLVEGGPLTVLKWINAGIFSMRESFFKMFSLLSEGKIDPLLAASKVKTDFLLPILDLMQSLIMDLMRLQLNHEVEIKNEDFCSFFMELKNKCSFRQLNRLMDTIQHIRSKLLNGINLNKQLVIESLFIQWVESMYVSR